MHKKGIVFGVFDGLHEGHKYFLNQAARACTELIIALTPEEVVKTLKGKTPKRAYSERENAIKEFSPDAKVVAGDAEPGTWNILKRHRPDIAILGYDQHGIARELEKMSVPFIFIDPHEPEKYKSSLMDKS